jgi:hypothetical protein
MKEEDEKENEGQKMLKLQKDSLFLYHVHACVIKMSLDRAELIYFYDLGLKGLCSRNDVAK